MCTGLFRTMRIACAGYFFLAVGLTLPEAVQGRQIPSPTDDDVAGPQEPLRQAMGSPSPPAPANCATMTEAFTNSTVSTIPSTAPPNVVTSTILVGGMDEYLWDLNLTTFITHTSSSDLDITLTSPAGTVVTITTDNGGGNDNVYNGTLWGDDADPDGQVPYTGNEGMVTDATYANLVVESPLVVEEALGAFVGEDPNGAWTLTISDDTDGGGGALNSWSLDVTTIDPAPATASTSFSDTTPLAIPTGPAVVGSVISVSGAGTSLCDLNLTTFITHTSNGDLDITLTSPAGTVVTITTDNGGSNDDVYNGTFWDDNADPDGLVPYTSNDGLVTDATYANSVVETPLVPEEALAAFISEGPNGAWTLTISDDTSSNGGSLNSWTLHITTCTCPVPCLADLNGDGVVNASDLALVLGAWGSNPGHPADINGDGVVNASDLALLLGNWGLCGDCTSAAECDDGEFCNGEEICLAERCDGGVPPDCGDDDPCTADTCEFGSGCVHTPGAPCNNDCIDRMDIFDGDTVFDTTGATTDGPAHAGCEHDGQTYLDIWYNYTATCTGDLTVSTCGQAEYDTDLVVYDGCDCADLALLECSDDAAGCANFTSEVIVPAVFNNCYKIRIGGFLSSDSGSGTLSIGCDEGCTVNSDCDDGNPCTTDECDEVLDCLHTPNSASCNDGLFCNGPDTCGNGSCSVHSGNPCAGGAECANGCNEQTEGCFNPAGAPCGSGGDTDCDNADTCDGAGNCLANVEPDGTLCSDGNACTGPDTCQGGTCTSGPGCDDGNPCTNDSCDPVDGCVHAANNAACDDGLFCNGSDTCSGGSCSSHTGNPCPGPDGDGNCSESCNEAANSCTAADPNGSSCNDGLFCNGADTCTNGSCVHAGNPCPGDSNANCSDCCNESQDNCTGLCPNASACNDGVFCNGADTCNGGSCSVHPGNPCSGDCFISCNEATDSCTIDPPGTACGSGINTNCDNPDTCDGNGVCQPNHELDGGLCFDGNFCDGPDTCQSGVCTRTGNPPDCDDDDPCTTDSCHPVAGCIHEPIDPCP